MNKIILWDQATSKPVRVVDIPFLDAMLGGRGWSSKPNFVNENTISTSKEKFLKSIEHERILRSKIKDFSVSDAMTNAELYDRWWVVHFIDTNVLLYTISNDEKDRAKREIACLLIETLDCVISLQSLAEFCSRAIKGRRREGIWYQVPLNVELVFGIANSWADRMTVIRPSSDTLSLAQRLVLKHKIQFFDAQLIAAAVEGGCDKFYSEDGHSGLKIENLEILNPFISI